MTVAVETIKVSKQYGPLWALKSVSLRINQGESVAILGPNGAGKTTIMKILATHVSPSSGAVNIFGKNAFKHGEDIRKRIGYAAHESFLYDELTIEENLSFYGKLFSAGLNSANPIIESLNLTRWYRTQVSQLSHGLRKRADITRALIHSPDLILLDELFEGLDEKTCNLLVDYFRNQQSKTVVISSHSIEWAKKLCARGVFLDRGEIAQDVNFR